MSARLSAATRRARFDKFGEEGLKRGVPTADGGKCSSGEGTECTYLNIISSSPEFLSAYTFHGDARRVFREFFGEDDPFAGL